MILVPEQLPLISLEFDPDLESKRESEKRLPQESQFTSPYFGDQHSSSSDHLVTTNNKASERRVTYASKTK